MFLTIGELRYLMAGGDPAEVERTKTALKSAAIGYGLAVLAPVVVTVLKSLVGRCATTARPSAPLLPAGCAVNCW